MHTLKLYYDTEESAKAAAFQEKRKPEFRKFVK